MPVSDAARAAYSEGLVIRRTLAARDPGQVGRHALDGALFKSTSRIRIECLNLLNAYLDHVQTVPGCLLDNGQSVKGDVFQVIANQYSHDFVKGHPVRDLQ